MDTNSNLPKDMNDLERRLSAWEPSHEGLDADAVLFAAGRASVRPSRARFTWPALSVLMTTLSLILGLCLADERNQRLALSHRLQERPPAPGVHSPSQPAVNTAPQETPHAEDVPPDSYLASRRALEEGLDAWPSRVVVHSRPADASFTNPPVLRLGQCDALLEP